MKFETTHASERGLRSYQEDRLVVYWVPDEGYLLATFDGHGGSECAGYCASRLIALCYEVVSTNPLNYEKMISSIFYYLNEETKDMGPGCAASLAFIPEDGTSIIVGVLGDAPVLIKQADGELWLAPEHNVRSNASEVKAAQERGGWISGGYLYSPGSGYGLQMSRALGDRFLGRVLNREPEIFNLPIGPSSFVLVATDGLFDPSHMSDASETIANAIECGEDAKQLVQNALDVPTGDNVSAILVKLSE